MQLAKAQFHQRENKWRQEACEGNRSFEESSEDFGLQSPLPNIGASGLRARAWVEHRSRIQPYIRTVRWVWGVSGILDCLRDSRVEEARARAAIMIA